MYDTNGKDRIHLFILVVLVCLVWVYEVVSDQYTRTHVKNVE